VKLVELIWLGQQLAEVGRRQLQESLPGVPMAEIVVMYDLIDHAPSAITGIAQRTGYAQSRVSSAVAGLAERGWVQIEADPSDGRRTIVVIAEQDRPGIKAAQAPTESHLVNELLDGVPSPRRPELMAALEDLLFTLRQRAEHSAPA
jgi:MarR family 2-MHQ and catechol resistance regulon transcriptional repressor